MMKLAKLIFVIIGVLLSVNMVFGLSASIGNAKAIIRVDLNEVPTIINRTILVNNVNEIPVSVAIKPNDDIKDIIQIEDKVFDLKPDASLKAKFKIVLKRPGTYRGKILVSFYPNDTTLKSQPVGMAAQLIIIASAVDGVNYPNYTPINETNNETNTIVENNSSNNDTHVTINLGGSKPKVNTTTNTDKKATTNTKNSSTSVIIGIITVVVIVLLGGIIFFVLMKKGVF